MDTKGHLIIKTSEVNNRNIMYSFSETSLKLLEIVDSSYRNKDETWGDSLYPILYFVRHSVELGLKILIKRMNPQHKFPGSAVQAHNLELLLRALYGLDSSLEANYPELKSIIEEFNQVDKDGTFFRYATNREGNNTQAPLVINWSNLSTAYKGFINTYQQIISDKYPDLWEIEVPLEGF